MLLVYKVLGFPKTEHVMLSKDKIEKKKQELTEKGLFLSTNDVVTAAICQDVHQSYESVVHSINYRQRWPGIGDRDSGNITRAVPFPAEECQDPNQVRRLVDSLKEQPNRDMPFCSFLRGRAYNQTNWASIQQVLDGNIFHAPLQSIVDANDIPIVIVYQPNAKEVGLIHKLTNLDPTTGLLSEIVK